MSCTSGIHFHHGDRGEREDFNAGSLAHWIQREANSESVALRATSTIATAAEGPGCLSFGYKGPLSVTSWQCSEDLSAGADAGELLRGHILSNAHC
ncbi:unnamed protein product [Boreogadus saida]